MTDAVIGTWARQPMSTDWEIVQRATDIVDVLRENALEGDRERQINKTALDAMDAGGLFSIMVPRRLGGLGSGATTLLEVLAELGRGDGAAGWTAALANAAAWFSICYDEQTQSDMWGVNPHLKSCGVFFPAMTKKVSGSGAQVEGGYVVTGEFAYGSASSSADWACLGMLVEQPDGTLALGLGWVPSSDFTIRDSWYSIGMRGTGSNTIVVDEAFVPAHRVMLFDDLAAGRFATPFGEAEPLSRAAFIPVATIILAGPMLGMAKAALEYSLEKLPKRPVGYTVYTEARNSPTHQLGVADAASKIDAAYLLMQRACGDIDRWAEEAHYPNDVQRGRIRMDIGHSVTLCLDAINTLMSLNGAGAFAQDGTLGRIWRDANTSARHAFAAPEIGKEVYGKLLLGADDPMSIQV